MTTDLLSLPERWAKAWCTNDAKPWVKLFSPNATYIDHGFRISRTGHEQLYRHHGLWRTANPDFIMTLDPTKEVWWKDIDREQGDGQCIFHTINAGTFKNNLAIIKPSGREFEFSGVLEFKIEQGLIVRLEEWYTREFDESVPVAQYSKEQV